MSGRKTSIADAGPSAAPTTAGLSGADQRAYVAAVAARDAAVEALSQAAAAVETHIGARSGPGYEAKLKAHRERYAEWRLAERAKAAKETR